MKSDPHWETENNKEKLIDGKDHIVCYVENSLYYLEFASYDSQNDKWIGWEKSAGGYVLYQKVIAWTLPGGTYEELYESIKNQLKIYLKSYIGDFIPVQGTYRFIDGV